MTLKEQIPIDCPQCKETTPTLIWRTLNVDVDPEDKELLFTGKINVFKCAKCGHEAGIETPLMYHDMRLAFVVQYYPPQYLNDKSFYEQFQLDGTLDVKGIAPENARIPLNLTAYLQKPYIVFNLNALLQYVVFRERLAQSKAKPEG
jgi:Zn ribbon nucleic-acid-binding protein